MISNVYNQSQQEGDVCKKAGKLGRSGKNSGVPVGWRHLWWSPDSLSPPPDWLVHHDTGWFLGKLKPLQSIVAALAKLHGPVQLGSHSQSNNYLIGGYMLGIHPLASFNGSFFTLHRQWKLLRRPKTTLLLYRFLMWGKDNGLIPGIPERKSTFQFSFYKWSCFTQ